MMKSTRTLSKLFLFALLSVGGVVDAQTVAPASELLQHAAHTESQVDKIPGQTVATRLFSVERKSRSETAATRFTLEMRQAPTLSAVSFRLYDETRRLLVGDWANTKENKTYRYEAGSAALTEVAAGAALWFTSDKVQVVKPTTAALGMLLAASSQTVVAETPADYTITCRFEDAGPMAGLIKARWVWSRAEKEVSNIFLTLENKEEIIEYKITPLAAAARPVLEEVAVVGSLDDVWFNPTPVALTETAMRNEVVAAQTKPTGAPATVAANNAASSNAGPALVEVGLGLRDKAVRKRVPVYKSENRQYKQKGTVTIFLEIDEKGAVAKIKKMEGPYMLQNMVRQAIDSWRFTPALVNGKPARMTGQIVFNFKEE